MINGRELFAEISNEAISEDGEAVGYFVKNSRMELLERLLTAPQAPALPDDYQHLKNVQELYRSQEERLFALAQRIKGVSFDKYSHTTAQVIDVLEREIFGEDGDACRAATLANRATRPQQSITDAIDRIVVPLSPDGLDEEKHHCEWHLYHDRERIRKELREYFSVQSTGEEQNEIEIGHDSYPDYVAGWNACRAAMLAAAPEGGN